MRKSVKIITGFLLTAILSAAAVFASFSDRLDVVNHISVGDVSISISEYARKGKGEVKYTQPSEVVPGQTISKIPRIKNNALPCWIRARITYAGENGKLERLKDENIGGISGEWVKRGEYYYYTKVLKKQESTDLFQNISIPDTWTEEHAKQKIAVDIQADAIQAANFKPDFSAMSPWGNQVIQKCVHEQDGTLTCKKGNTKLSVEFNGKAHKLIAVPDDFFTNLESAMPGDILKDAVQIANTTDQEAELFFQTNTDGRSEEQMNMLKKVRFEISQNKKILYKGTLDAAELAKARSLGKFKSGQKGRLEFQLEIPREWDNAYALKKTDITWIFAVKENEKKETKTNSTKKDSSSVSKVPKQEVTQKKESDSKSNNTTQQPTQNTKQIEQSNSNSQGNNSGQKNNVSTSFYDSITGGKKEFSSESACFARGTQIQNAELDYVLDYNEQHPEAPIQPEINYFRCYPVIDEQGEGWYLHFFCRSGEGLDSTLKSKY